MEKLKSIIFLFVNCFLIIVNGDLTLTGTRCGTKTCSEMEFCSEYDLLCKPCSSICDKSHHNFDETLCTKNCQNYLHDMRYSKNYNQNSDNDLRAEVENLRYMVSVTLTLTCLILVVLAIVILIKFFHWNKKHNFNLAWIRSKLKLKKKTKSDRPATVSVTTASGKPDLRLDMPPGLQTPSVNGNTPSTATTTISRRPTEDNTLDYAYDNPAMVSTPSPNAKPHESSL